MIREAASGRRRRAFTLIEAMIASVFLAVSVVGVSSALMASSYQSRQIDETTTAGALARELLEEMTARSFTAQSNAGYSSGLLTRLNYDDVTDYDGYTDSTHADSTHVALTTLEGTPITIGDGVTYTRKASFSYSTTPGGTAAPSGDFGLATVTVTTPDGVSVTLQRVLSNPISAR